MKNKNKIFSDANWKEIKDWDIISIGNDIKNQRLYRVYFCEIDKKYRAKTKWENGPYYDLPLSKITDPFFILNLKNLNKNAREEILAKLP